MKNRLQMSSQHNHQAQNKMENEKWFLIDAAISSRYTTQKNPIAIYLICYNLNNVVCYTTQVMISSSYTMVKVNLKKLILNIQNEKERK